MNIMRQKSKVFLSIAFLIAIALIFYINYQTTQNNAPTKSHAEAQAQAPRITGYLHTSGTKILDENNNEILLQGVDDQRMIFGNGTAAQAQCYSVPNQTEVDNIASWGFNFVRLGISWANLEPTPPIKNTNGTYTHNWNQTYLSQIDQTIAGLQKKGIAVILDMHQVGWFPNSVLPAGKNCPKGAGMPTWLYFQDTNGDGINKLGPGQAKYPRCDFFTGFTKTGVSIPQQDGFVAVWQYLTTRYKDNPTVFGADILNEPNVPSTDCPISATVLNDFYNKLGLAIHSINPKLLLVYAHHKDYTSPSPDQTNNWIYTRHIYPKDWQSDGLPLFQQAIDTAKKFNVPLWIGEFGGLNLSTDPATRSLERSKMLSYLHANNLNWSWFEYDEQTSDHLVSGQSQTPDMPLINAIQSAFGFSITTTIPPAAGTSLNLKLKFQGITKKPANSSALTVKVTIAADGSSQTATSNGTFTPDNNGVYSGNVSFSSIPSASKYYLLIKGPKHIQKKVCVATPTELTAGTYHCGAGAITLTPDNNSIDASGITLLSGDLPPQDGVVDSYDISLVRNNLGSQDPKVLSSADINLDEIVDSQDFSLIISSLNIKYDEEGSGTTGTTGGGPTPTPTLTPTDTPQPTSTLGQNVIWGACGYPQKCDGHFISSESQLGRSFAVAKTYHTITTPGLTPNDQSLVSSGHSLLYSIDPPSPKSGGGYTFFPLKDISAGIYDSQILAQLQQLNGISTTPYLIFDGEAENLLEIQACSAPRDAQGKPNYAVCGPEFVAAWKHVRDMIKQHGLSRIQMVWTLTAKSFHDNPTIIDAYFPGEANVDWLGVDGYNQDCGTKSSSYPQDTFEHIFSSTMAWHDARTPTLPISLTEWGAPVGPNGDSDRVVWLQESASHAKSWPSIKMMAYWDGGHTSSTYSGCDFTIAPDQPSFQTFKSIGLDSYFGRH